MSCGTYGLTIRDLEARVSYPPFKKKVPWQEPHRSLESRRLVEEYKRLAAADKQERQRYAIAAGGSGAAAAAAMSSTSDASGNPPPSAGKRGLNSAKLSSTPNPYSLISAAEAAEESGKVDDAVGCLLEALRLCNITSPGNPLASLAAEINEKLGMHQVDKELYQDSIGYFTAGVEIDPTFSRNYLHRAECYVLLDNPQKAFDEYEKYFKLEHASKAQLVRCGKCALDADLLDDAQHYLESTIQYTPHPTTSRSDSRLDDASTTDASNDAYAYYNLGELEEKRKNDDRAREYFAKVHATDPTFYLPYEEQAEQEYENGNYTMALHVFEALAKILPEAAQYFVRLADVYEHLGEEYCTSVLSCLSRALELKQDSKAREITLVRRGTLLFTFFQQLNDALADFTMCLSVNPTNADALNNRALVYRARGEDGDHQAAVADYQTLVDLSGVELSFKAEPHRYLANYFFTSQTYDVAAKYFSLASLFKAALTKDDGLRLKIAVAHTTIQQGDVFEETYEPRGWPSRESNEKGKKADPGATKGNPVPSLSYTMVDNWYVMLRDREPTMHNELEYMFITTWKSFREEVERKREEADAVRAGKKPKKGK